jgi:hypothetical protein
MRFEQRNLQIEGNNSTCLGNVVWNACRSSICRRWRKRPSGTFTGFTPRGKQVVD